MYCPHSIVYSGKHLHIVIHTRGDYYGGIPLREKLNPLRYEVFIFSTSRPYPKRWRVRINNKGRWEIKRSNFVWKHLGGEKRWNKKNLTEKSEETL